MKSSIQTDIEMNCLSVERQLNLMDDGKLKPDCLSFKINECNDEQLQDIGREFMLRVWKAVYIDDLDNFKYWLKCMADFGLDMTDLLWHSEPNGHTLFSYLCEKMSWTYHRDTTLIMIMILGEYLGDDIDMINVKDNYMTPFMYAIKSKNEALVDALMKRFVIDLHFKNRFGKSAFDMALDLRETAPNIYRMVCK